MSNMVAHFFNKRAQKKEEMLALKKVQPGDQIIDLSQNNNSFHTIGTQNLKHKKDHKLATKTIHTKSSTRSMTADTISPINKSYRSIIPQNRY